MIRNDYKNYSVVFETVGKKPITRTVTVSAQSEQHAAYIVASEFDSFTYNKESFTYLPTGKHIKITEVKALA